MKPRCARSRSGSPRRFPSSLGGSQLEDDDLHHPEGAIPDRVTLLADVAEIVSRSHDLNETLGNVVDLVAKRLDADACSIYLIEADMRKLTLSATFAVTIVLAPVGIPLLARFGG